MGSRKHWIQKALTKCYLLLLASVRKGNWKTNTFIWHFFPSEAMFWMHLKIGASLHWDLFFYFPPNQPSFLKNGRCSEVKATWTVRQIVVRNGLQGRHWKWAEFFTSLCSLGSKNQHRHFLAYNLPVASRQSSLQCKSAFNHRSCGL